MSCIAKILAKAVYKELIAVLDKNCILDKCKSDFRSAHSSETALYTVSMHSDAGGCSVLLMLDFTSAFDTVGHHILYNRVTIIG